jgi:site-specific recombinase XerD
MSIKSKNEKIKRKYFKWLAEACGYSEATVNSIENAIWHYEDFSQNADYAGFSQSKAVGFKKWLSDRKYRGKAISVTTIYHHLRHLKGFFTWLSGQSGYKSKINRDNISYLSLEKKKVREAISARSIKFPSLEHIQRLVKSIDIKTEIDKRDKALISFLFLSGMRDKAIATLPLACFNRKTLEIQQDPKLGVDTKFGKVITTTLLKFDDDMIKCIIEWSNYLEKEKLFGSSDPLFPRNKIERQKGGLTFVSYRVEPLFWKTTGSIRQIMESRSARAGLDYYHPHSFRHAAIHLAMKKCRNAEDMKAISQNFGHEYVGTTMMTYGNLDDFRVHEIVGGLDFSENLDVGD